MDIKKISTGKNPPYDVNVLIEIPIGGHPIKYEFDKQSGAIFVDRFLHTAMYYPGNYGFIPHTLSEDGDPTDVIVIGRVPVIPGCILRARPIGALIMEDEAGSDEKIVAVPVQDLHPYYDTIKSYKDLQQVQVDQMEHFFSHYKDLEQGKWVKVKGWVDADAAFKLILDAMERAKKNS